MSISSISGRRGAPRRALYAATKAALDGMTRALAMEYGPRGIRANAVAPGVVDTDLWHENLAKPGVADAVLEVIPTRPRVHARGGGRHGGVPRLGRLPGDHWRDHLRRRRHPRHRQPLADRLNVTGIVAAR